MKKRYIVWLLSILCLAAGCTGGDPEQAGSSFATVIDQAGRQVVLASEPLRLVSLSPAITEMVFALGLGGRLEGVTDYCNYPEEAAEKPKIGGFSTPNVEAVMAREPDLVLAGDMHAEIMGKLEAAGVPVLVLAPKNVEEIYDALALLGEVTGVQQAAAALAAEMRQRMQAVQAVLDQVEEKDRLRVFYEVYSDPLMSAGKKTVISQVIALAGGKNIFDDVEIDYPEVSAEAVVQRDPQVILFPSYHGTAEFILEHFINRPGWSQVAAIKERRIYSVDDDGFVRPGPRVVEAVESTARLFYPDLFE